MYQDKKNKQKKQNDIILNAQNTLLSKKKRAYTEKASDSQFTSHFCETTSRVTFHCNRFRFAYIHSQPLEMQYFNVKNV